MYKNLMVTLLLVQITPLVGCRDRENSREEALPFEILEQERLKKGGSLDPLLPPQYVLFRVQAAVSDTSPELTGTKVRATLRALLSEVRSEAERRGQQIDGVSAFLYQSRDHISGGSAPLGQADWWPKGHSFSPENVANINNKATYAEEFVVNEFALPKPTERLVERLSENQRREIYIELVRAEDRADREAEAKYPTDASNIPISRLSSYDFKTAIENNVEAARELSAKYVRAILQRHGITEQELHDIEVEAMLEQWPLPPR